MAGPGDFFGETGLLEGREKRGASVVCRTPVEVMAMDREIFKQVAGSGEQGNKIADSMRAKADARQRARLTRVLCSHAHIHVVWANGWKVHAA